MRYFGLLALILFSFTHAAAALAEAPGHVWSKRFGEPGVYNQFVNEVAFDGAGDVIIAGRFRGSVNFGGGVLTSVGGWDFYVAKFDRFGNHLWSRAFGNALDQTALHIATDSAGNVILAGALTGLMNFGGGILVSAGGNDVFVVALDSQGNHLRSARFGDSADQTATDVACDGADNAIVAGYFSGTVNFGGVPLTSFGIVDAFAVKFSSTGAHVWSHHPSQSGDSKLAFSAVACDSGDRVCIGGTYYTWCETCDPPQYQANGYYSKLDSGGSLSWTRVVSDGTTYQEYDLTKIAVDGAGNIISTGYTMIPLVGAQLILEKRNPSGDLIWSGPAANCMGNSVAVDGYSNIIVCGLTLSTVDFGGGPLYADNNMFGVEFDSAGNHVWSDIFDNPTLVGSSAEAVAADGAGQIVIGGEFLGGIDFGGGTLTSVGGYDGFLVKFALSPVGIHSSDPPACPKLRVYPNPLHGVSTILYEVAEVGPVTVSVYDVAGHRVRTLAEQTESPGPHSIDWDGSDGKGGRLPSGVYFVRLHQGGQALVTKVVLTR